MSTNAPTRFDHPGLLSIDYRLRIRLQRAVSHAALISVLSHNWIRILVCRRLNILSFAYREARERVEDMMLVSL